MMSAATRTSKPSRTGRPVSWRKSRYPSAAPEGEQVPARCDQQPDDDRKYTRNILSPATRALSCFRPRWLCEILFFMSIARSRSGPDERRSAIRQERTSFGFHSLHASRTAGSHPNAPVTQRGMGHQGTNRRLTPTHHQQKVSPKVKCENDHS